MGMASKKASRRQVKCKSLGISLCFHRMLTHHGVVCPKWLERFFAIHSGNLH
jgi:fatty-acid desaturase